MQAERPEPQINPVEGKPGMFAFDYIPDNPELSAEIQAEIEKISVEPQPEQSERREPQLKPIEGKPGMFAYDYIPDNPKLRAEITAWMNAKSKNDKVVEDALSRCTRILNHIKSRFPGI
jgi:hypothetical protein